MNLRTIARFQIGDPRAIQTVATNRAAFFVGIALVLLTAVARNHDQAYIGEKPFWLFGPLLFSFFSGSFLFWIVYCGFIRRHLPEGPRPSGAEQWHSFMTVFWMTAPIAWLYALPVERFFEPIAAAKANLTLLGIVSLWRVLLMGRVISVLNGVPYSRAVSWVLVGASIEVIFVVFFGGLFSPTFGRRVLAGMSGMRNAPEENLLSSALGTAFGGAWLVLVVVILGLAVPPRLAREARPFPEKTAQNAPWWGLLFLAVIWAGLALPAQLEQRRFHAHAKLIEAEKYTEALVYLSRYQKQDFPPARRLEPNPYEYRVWEHLPRTVAAVNTNTPAWVRATYLGHLSRTLEHHWMRFRSVADVTAMIQALEQMPEGRQWVLTNQARFVQKRLWNGMQNSADGTSITNIVQSLRRIGVAESNLATLPEL